MKKGLNIISNSLFEEFLKHLSADLVFLFDSLKDSETSTPSFNFYTSVSAIASSKIEGEKMELDSYIKHKMLNIDYQGDLTQKPNDLYEAYLFAQNHKLTEENFLKCHCLITAHLLTENKQGKYRIGNMVVLEHNTGRIQYEAAPGKQIAHLNTIFWEDIESLILQDLNPNEVLYYASFIHLVFVNIHPFEDGNGRAARLLEKWFIAEKLGPKAWYLQSELFYYNHVNDYYKNLNRLGLFYDELDYSLALPFLLMLHDSLKNSDTQPQSTT